MSESEDTRRGTNNPRAGEDEQARTPVLEKASRQFLEHGGIWKTATFVLPLVFAALTAWLVDAYTVDASEFQAYSELVAVQVHEQYMRELDYALCGDQGASREQATRPHAYAPAPTPRLAEVWCTEPEDPDLSPGDPNRELDVLCAMVPPDAYKEILEACLTVYDTCEVTWGGQALARSASSAN